MKPIAEHDLKARLFAEFARIGKALSSPHRLHLIDVLAQGELSVEQLARATAQPIANVSQHLKVLRAVHLVALRRQGVFMFYRLADPRVFRVWQAVRELGEARLAEIDRVITEFLGHRNDMEAVDAVELRRRLHAGDVVVLDVRPTSEYDAGHIAGARSVPLKQLQRGLRSISLGSGPLGSISKRLEIVAYCRGPYCVLADEAVAFLRARGFRAKRLTEGFPDWQLRGFPIAAGAAQPKLPAARGK